jgi:hypothetical protein
VFITWARDSGGLRKNKIALFGKAVSGNTKVCADRLFGGKTALSAKLNRVERGVSTAIERGHFPPDSTK